jgi:hypothetical protein
VCNVNPESDSNNQIQEISATLITDYYFVCAKALPPPNGGMYFHGLLSSSRGDAFRLALLCRSEPTSSTPALAPTGSPCQISCQSFRFLPPHRSLIQPKSPTTPERGVCNLRHIIHILFEISKLRLHASALR